MEQHGWSWLMPIGAGFLLSGPFLATCYLGTFCNYFELLGSAGHFSMSRWRLFSGGAFAGRCTLCLPFFLCLCSTQKWRLSCVLGLCKRWWWLLCSAGQLALGIWSVDVCSLWWACEELPRFWQRWARVRGIRDCLSLVQFVQWRFPLSPISRINFTTCASCLGPLGLSQLWKTMALQWLGVMNERAVIAVLSRMGLCKTTG